ncbi:MAG: hypothetical protein LBK18_10745, partial [Prevotellaceae bacterium]|nr:hypothetical protein [Prevotellaceae bacterium]
MSKMRRSVFLIFLLLQVAAAFAAHRQRDTLLLALDRTIKEKSSYAEKRERRIDSLKILLNEEACLEQRFRIYQKLYKEYRRYSMSAALSVADKKLIIAQELQNRQYVYIAEMNTAEILGIMGMYKESLDILNGIDRRELG